MDKKLILYKKRGETPLATMERFRATHPEYALTPMTYAGRLDPMAEGVLLVLTGEVCKDKEQYLSLPKTYQFEILVGFATDTYDALGLVTENTEDEVTLETIKQVGESFGHTFIQKYPPYSSKTVRGVQLHTHAREDTLGYDELPEHEVTITKLSFEKTYTKSGEEILREIQSRIGEVVGDFRQKEIMQKWGEIIVPEKMYMLVSGEVSCGGGFYVRTFVHNIGEHSSVPMLAYSIKRTQLGQWSEKDITQ